MRECFCLLTHATKACNGREQELLLGLLHECRVPGSGPSSAAFLGILSEIWIGKGELRLERAPLMDADLANCSFNCYATAVAPGAQSCDINSKC